MAVRPIHTGANLKSLFGDHWKSLCPKKQDEEFFSDPHLIVIRGNDDCTFSPAVIEESLKDGVLDQKDLDRYNRTSPISRDRQFHMVRALYVNMRRFAELDNDPEKLSKKEAVAFRQWFDKEGKSMFTVFPDLFKNSEVLGNRLISIDLDKSYPHISGNELLIATHPTGCYDIDWVAWNGINREVRDAKKNGSKVLYLYDGMGRFDLYYPSDVDPDYFINSQKGEFPFTTEAENITLVGGYFERCLYITLNFLLINNTADNLTIRMPSDAVYVDPFSRYYGKTGILSNIGTEMCGVLVHAVEDSIKLDRLNKISVEHRGEEIFFKRYRWFSGRSIKFVID